MSPISKVVGYLLGLPVREWVLFLLTLPFSFWCFWKGGIPLEVFGELYAVVVSTALLYHMTALLAATVMKNRRLAFLGSMSLIFALYTAMPAASSLGLVAFEYVTITPTVEQFFPKLTEIPGSEPLDGGMARFFGFVMPHSRFTLISQGAYLLIMGTMLWRLWRHPDCHLLGKFGALVSFVWMQAVLFNKEKTLLHTYPAGKKEVRYAIPDSVEIIEIYSFYKATNLTSLTISDSVTSIRTSAFYTCINLASITIPDSVTEIDRGTFSHCTSLASITIPDSVTSIGKNAFLKCSNLTSITFQGLAPTVGTDAFEGVADGAIALVTPKALKSFGQVGDKWNGLTLKIGSGSGSASIATDRKEVAAGHSDEKELLLLSSHLNTGEVDFPPLLKKRETWKISRISAQLKIDTAYLARLEKLKTSMVKKGEITAARAIDNAIKGGTRTDDEPAVLTKSRQVRYDALLAAMKPIDQQYWKDLTKLKEDAQSKGDLEQVEFVLSEITRVLAPYK